MPALALVEALADFGTGFTARPGQQRPQAEPQPSLPGADVALPDFLPSRRDETAIAEAVETARASLREELEREHEAALETERARHRQELDAANAAMGADLASRVSSRLDDMEGRLASVTGDLAARILGTALTQDLQRRAVEGLQHVIGEALADNDAIRIRVAGASVLFQALQEALGDKAGKLEFTEGDGPDLTVTIDETIFGTRLAEWSETLAEVLG